MIKLTRLDGKEILLNDEYVEIIEETPDTVVSLQNGHKLLVKENINEIMQRINKSKGFMANKFRK